jgi:hypothetical protein
MLLIDNYQREVFIQYENYCHAKNKAKQIKKNYFLRLEKKVAYLFLLFRNSKIRELASSRQSKMAKLFSQKQRVHEINK